MAATEKRSTSRKSALKLKPGVPTPERPFVFNEERDTWVCLHHGDQDFSAWVPCWNGCDEGFFDEYDKDPINYAPGESWERCSECHGKGGWNVCPVCNARNSDAEF